MSKILLLERVGILHKELPGVFFIVQMKTRNQDQVFRQLLFVQRVPISTPCRCERRGSLLSQELFQDLFPPEFPHGVLINLHPIRPE